MTEECLNLGAGKTIRLSSYWRGREPAAENVLTGRPTGRFSFHTTIETDPWILVDLHRAVPVARIMLWNREDAGLDGLLRAVPLRIEAAAEHEAWCTLATIGIAFGGALSNTPFDFRLPHPILARFIRLTALGIGALHLDKVFIFSPDLTPGTSPRYGRLTNLRFLDGWPTADIAVRWNQGFFSNCSVALQMAMSAAARGFTISEIDFSASMWGFREKSNGQPHLFVADTAISLPVPATGQRLFNAWDVHNHYRDFRFDTLTPFIHRLFRPHPEVAEIEQSLVAHYAVDQSNTIVILYRGTDKRTEISPTDIAEYLALADRLLATRPGHRVCIQTDQKQIQDQVKAHFGERCFAFDSLPVTEGSVVIHRTDVSRHGLDRTTFGQTLLAAIHLLAAADIVITHTGNVGAWISLYRGHARNLFQFDSKQALIAPYNTS
ncbi:discoidin domain-containing protein [Plastoroseomonas arctica]|uniref:Discoidin domain-containing protein n=1 Tax=Plastoroseomonas arctica TaxID=1509237 RepID=A0AAF1JY86_9PROT|nr:discoidin domain-containing protein [Plastoroseomonas arctica]MBR0656642.1 discoidin domain-containing protein [Plastoroseomonas arctica]